VDRNIQIMIIDDSPSNLLLMEDILSMRNYSVLTFSSAREALKLLDTSMPSLILLDIMMPGMDGYIFLSRIMSRKETSQIPVIIVSARNDDAAIRKAYTLGAAGFMTKPIIISELLEKVQYFLTLEKNIDSSQDLLKCSSALE
jgi:two-component system, NtrC family, sensor kinase